MGDVCKRGDPASAQKKRVEDQQDRGAGLGEFGDKGEDFVLRPDIDREEARVNKMIASICRGC